ncbi:MAG: hypothetical protein EPN85_08450 [Bacteroidetes bacterium]|nr:MAG: hypothetical protein EPN85_08450 [Bacteroidota bacterium]
MEIINYNYVENYLLAQQAKGIYWFVPDELCKAFQASPNAIKKTLQRLHAKKKVVRIRREFYVIIPPEYSATGILPASLYIHALMKFLKRDYYVGLYSAAALHGASHQQPQDFCVVTKKPFLRNIRNKKVVIHFAIKKEWDSKDVIEKKSDTGYIKVSSPELTALDVVYFQDNVGGLNRVATILDELAEEINSEKLTETAGRYGQIATVQRLGYFLEEVLQHKDKTEPLYNWLKKQVDYPVFLKAGKKIKRMNTNNRWKVIKNFSPESDL